MVRGATLAMVLAGCLVVAGAAPAVAASDPREVQARADFAAGRYQQAIDAFALMYGETGDPLFLRNIARCHQKLKRPHEAIDAFRDYLRKAKKLSSSERREIEGYIKDMEALAATQSSTPAPAAATPTPPPAPTAEFPPSAPPAPTPAPTPTADKPAAAVEPLTPPPVPPPAASPGPSAPAAVAVAVSPPPTTGADDGGGLRAAGVVVGIAGLAIVGAGVAFGIVAQGVSDEVSQQYDPVREKNGKLDETLSIVGYAVGGAAIVTGVVMYAIGAGNRGRAPGSAVGLRLVPNLDRNGGGLLVGGRF